VSARGEGMDHRTAIRSGAAERYLLGELQGDERSDYEAHFFECQACAEELRDTQLFLAGARKALATGSPAAAGIAERRSSPWWTLFWPLPLGALGALGLLLAIVAYQSLAVLPRLRDELALAQSPRAASWHFLAVSRGEPAVIVSSPRHPVVGLTLAPPAGPALPSYRCEVRAGDGRLIWSLLVPGPAPGREIELVLPVSQLRPGAYVIALAPGSAAAGPGPELARYPFTVELGED
jgi:hypothetical protein